MGTLGWFILAGALTTADADLAPVKESLAIRSPKIFPLFVGIDQYDNVPSLMGAVPDALKVLEALKNVPGSLIEDDPNKENPVLKDRVTEAEIRGALASTVKRMRSGDMLLFFFSGHSGFDRGSKQGGNYVLWASDSGHRSDQSGGINIMSELRTLAPSLRGESVLLIIDGCETPAAEIVSTEVEGVEVTALVSTRRGEVSIEGPFGKEGTYRGLFSSALEESIIDSKGDINLDGLISVDEIFIETYKRCVGTGLKTNFGPQYPSYAGSRSHVQYLFRVPGLKRVVTFPDGIPPFLKAHANILVNAKLYKIDEVQSETKTVKLSTDDGTLRDGFVAFGDKSDKQYYWMGEGMMRRIKELPDPDKSHAVIVWIGDHNESIGLSALPGIRNAAARLEKVLSARGFGHIKTFSEKCAKRKDIQEYLGKFNGEIKADRLVFVFMGHGMRDEESRKPFLITADYEKGRTLADKVMSVSWLQSEFMADTKAKDVLCVIDACEAGVGALARKEKQATALTAIQASGTNTILAWLDKTKKSKCLLTSTYRDEEANTTADGAGLFSSELITALEGVADENGDGIITTTEIYNYCSLRINRILAERRRDDPTVPMQEVSVLWDQPGGYQDKLPDSQFFFLLPISSY